MFSWARIPLDQDGDVQNVFPLPPDWSIKILSPAQSPTRVINNLLFRLNQGTRLGTLIDPDDPSVITFQPGQQPISHDSPEEILLVPDWCQNWQLTFEELFGWLNFPG